MIIMIIKIIHIIMIMTKTLCRASTAELYQMPMASALVLSPLVAPRI